MCRWQRCPWSTRGARETSGRKNGLIAASHAVTIHEGTMDGFDHPHLTKQIDYRSAHCNNAITVVSKTIYSTN